MVRRVVLASVILIAVSCGDPGPSEVTAAEYRAFRSQTTACGATPPAAAIEMSFTEPGDAAVTGPIRAVVTTSCGSFTVLLHPEVAPLTVNSFVFLAERGYFDGTVSHRIFPGFVVQAGDPTASGGGSPGYRIPDELPPADFEYTSGVVAMANRGPNTGGSQFFVVLADIDLDPDYTVFGTVVDGYDTLDAIAGIPLGPNPRTFEPSHPLETLYLESVTIER